MATEGSSQMLATPRVRFAPVSGAAELFSPAFVEYLVRLHDEFTPRIHGLRARRAEMLKAAHEQGIMPTHLPVSEVNTGTWKVPPFQKICSSLASRSPGPASITHMFINALNPGPEGTRAEEIWTTTRAPPDTVLAIPLQPPGTAWRRRGGD
jgi:hypothetical protein